MRILLVCAGGVGAAGTRIAARRSFAELVIADYDLGRARRAAATRDGYEAVRLDARDERAVAGLLARRRGLIRSAGPQAKPRSRRGSG